MQPVLAFQTIGNTLASTMQEILIQTPSVFINVYGDDVQVVAADVFVLKHHVGLIAVAEFFEIFLGDGRQLRIGQTVVGVRIERDMNNRIPGTHLRGHAAREILRCPPDVEASRPLVEDFVRGEQPSLPLVDLFAVISQHAVKRASYVNFGNHCV